MRRLTVFFIILLLFGESNFCFAGVNEFSRKRPSVGLVLSGGGAKGFAHIGILKMLDSLKIPVDYIAGTSMGAIIGGLYSIGYKGVELEQLARRSDWEEIFTDKPPRKMLPYFEKKQTGKYQLEFYLKGVKPIPPSGLIYGQKVLLLFTSLTFPFERVKDFDQLPIPFRCVAVDLVSGNEVVLHRGSLAKALRATMAIPTAFSPVEWGDSLLVDGGLVNNLPADVAKKMGADIIIAVDVESPLKSRKELNSAIDVLNQTVTLLGIERKRKNLKYVDLLIKPNVRGFTTGDFESEKIKVLIKRGNEAAKAALPRLLALKEKYHLNRLFNEASEQVTRDSVRIHDIQITGNRSVENEFIFSKLHLSPGQIFDSKILERGIAELKSSGLFRKISYEIVPYRENQARLFLRVVEREKPLIFRVDISGNRHLPFSFIYQLLGFKPGDRLDVEKLSRQIMQMYGLGYFEHLEYSIEPALEGVILKIRVKELPIRRLRVGVRYDDHYRLVGVVSGQATNLFIPGIRFENELQFAGLNRFRGKISYPSRALNLPIYPFVYIEMKDIPTWIFGSAGFKIASYRDRSFRWGGGIGFQLFRSFDLEIQYQQERLNIKPEIGFPYSGGLSEWKDELHQLSFALDIDVLDDVLLPHNGFQINAKYEQSFQKLKTDLPFKRFEASGDFYFSPNEKNMLRFFGFYGDGSKDLPIYKYFNKGKPEYFVGLEFDQLTGNKLTIFRLDYRYEHKKDVFFKIMANVAVNSSYRIADVTYPFNTLYGFGFGVKLLSPIGPLELIFSRGTKNMTGEQKYQNQFYVIMGYKF
ncbi:MAG: BamA/TamA family outer membrane protein [Calditrichaeota bacterium]|nr:BamA/TamA family outer membrane protein [Calditrichota bacterium]